MASTRKRSFVKGLTWELLGIAILYLLTGEWKIVGSYFALRVVLYFVYERVWKKIKWGKRNAVY